MSFPAPPTGKRFGGAVMKVVNMASAAEQMAANLSWGALGKATDLRQRIFFTVGLLIVYRLGTYIPVPGIDGGALRDFMAQISGGIGDRKSVV